MSQRKTIFGQQEKEKKKEVWLIFSDCFPLIVFLENNSILQKTK